MHSRDRMTLQLVSHRPLPDQHQLSRASRAFQTAPGIQQAAQILFLGQTSDVRHQDIIGTNPERPTVGLTPEGRVELFRVYSATPNSGVENSASVQVPLVEPRRAQHFRGP